MSEYSPFRLACSPTSRISIMTSGDRSCWAARLGLAAAVAFIAVYLQAADRSRQAPRTNRARPAETVEMFRAIKDGKIDVKLIPKDSKQSNLLIENKTDKPLSVQLPDAFAGVPVLAQVGGLGAGGGLGVGGGLGAGGRGRGGLGGGQAFGGGFGGGGLGGGGFGGGGGGFFNVPPEKVGKLRVTIVCLEHGKPNPRPAMKYEIKPIVEFTDKKEVHELCRMLGSGLVDQRSAQAAAWHLNCHMTWRQLVAKQLKFANGTTRPYFHRAEIHRAMQAVSVATQLVQKRKRAGPQKSRHEQIGVEVH